MATGMTMDTRQKSKCILTVTMDTKMPCRRVRTVTKNKNIVNCPQGVHSILDGAECGSEYCDRAVRSRGLAERHKGMQGSTHILSLPYSMVLLLPLLSILVSPVHSQMQSFREEPADTEVIQGQTAILKCSVDNMAGQLHWTKEGFSLGYGRELVGFSRYSVTGSEAIGENALMIRSVELSDDGTFQCQVLPRGEHPAIRASAYLSVLIPPVQPVIDGYANGSVVKVPHQEESLSMTCLSVHGKPAAEIKWYRNDELLEAPEHAMEYSIEELSDKRQNAKSILTIKPRKEDNDATFKCETLHKALTKSLETMVMLSVMHPPSDPEISGYTNGQVIQTNHTLKLVCIARGGNPLAQVYWYKNGKGLDFSYEFGANKAENDLTFLVEPTDNEAVYRCEASNLVTPEPLSAEVKLTVQFPPKTVKISGQEHAKAGETIKLKCQTTISNPPAVISWFSRGRLIDSITTSTKPSPKGGFITTSEIEVTLTSSDDQVVYQCNGNNEALGLGSMDTISLKVVYPPGQPTITGYTEGREVTAGQIQSMTCQSMGGNPPATLTWWKGDEELQAVSTRNFGLVSSQVSFILKPNDNGAQYRCNATNPATITPLLAEVQLTVNFPPKSLDITVSPKKGRVGERLTLTCRSASSNPASTVYWVKDGDQLPEGIDQGQVDAAHGGKSSVSVLELTPTVDDNGEIYACNAENILIERAVSDAVTLDILFKPVFPADASTQFNVVEFGQGSINLTAISNPKKVTYTWYRNNQKIITGGSRRRRDIEIPHFVQDGGALEIQNITRDDHGSYVVKAKNSEGTGTHTILINVQYPAEITKVSQNVLADKDTEARLECVVDANPLDDSHIIWSRSGYNMSNTLTEFDAAAKRSVLVITSVVKEDSGLFVCTANNSIGEAHQTSAQLIVKYAPEIDKSPTYGKAAADKGATAKLVCKAEGAPDVTFKWNRNGAPLDLTGTKYSVEAKKPGLVQHESYLSVHMTTKSDYGQYECVATNDLGQDSHMISLDGTSKPDPPFDLQVVEATHNSITLSWKQGFDGGSSQTFQVRYLEVGETEGHKYADVVPTGSTIYTIIGLKPATEYKFDVRAINKLGESGYQPEPFFAKSALKGDESDDEVPLIIILVVSIIGMILLGLNVLLILFFIRRRRKKLEKDGSSITNTVEMYNAPTITDDSKSINTYDRRSYDEYQDDYGKPFDDDDELRRFLGPAPYGPMDNMGHYKGPDYYPTRNEYSPPPGSNKPPPFRDDIYDPIYGPPPGAPPPSYPANSLPRAPPGGYNDDDDDYTDQLRKMQMSLGGPLPGEQDFYGPRAPPPLPPARSSSRGALDAAGRHPGPPGHPGPPVPSRNYSSEDIPRYSAPPGGSAYGSLPHPGSHQDLPPPPPDMRGHLV